MHEIARFGGRALPFLWVFLFPRRNDPTNNAFGIRDPRKK
jgi:hypothetical protein